MLMLGYTGDDSADKSQKIVTFLQNLYTPQHLLILVEIVCLVILSLPIFLVLLDYLDFRHIQKKERVFIELTPPGISVKSSHANSQLFAVLHGLYSINSFKDRLLRRKQAISLEVVSTRKDGIRFIACVPRSSISSFQQTVVSYLPHIQFKEIPDYLLDETNGKYGQLVEFKLWRHFARPLRSHDALAQHDPIAFITGSLAKPEPGEILALQFVLTPADPREARRVHNKLLVGKEPGLTELSWKLPFQLLLKLFLLQFKIAGALIEGIAEIFSSDYTISKPTRPQTKALQAIDDKMLNKLQQPQFRTDIRAYVVVDSKQEMRERLNGLVGSLASFQDPGYQALHPRRNLLLARSKRWQRFRMHKFITRLPSMLTTNFCMLSAEEVANLFHFPYGQAAQAENTVKSFSKTLAAPVTIKKHADNKDFDVVLGVNRHHGSDTEVGLTAAERQRHLYIVGGTGNGKTTMMEYAIVQDIRNGKGVAMIDPHGDSARKILKYIPKERLKDVIYLNPRDLDYPIGLNLLELPEGLEGSELEHEKDRVAEAVISVLRKVFDDNTDANAYRIERVMRNAIHTAFTVEDATLFTVLRLLTDGSYRKQITRNLEDESLKRFWKEELGKAGEFQRVKISGGPISRIERYERSVAARRMLEQPKSTIDFDDILNSSKILICNFSKGRLGEDTSALFGVTVLAKLQLAAWRRDEIAEDKRVPFYPYVDEFQLFATEAFMGLFSEARKYKLFVTIAQQSVAQLSEQSMLNTILDNVGTLVAFRSKSPDTEKLLLHQFSPFIEQGEILNLPAYNFYMKIAAVEPQEPLSGETIVLPKDDADEKRAQEVIKESRKRWATSYVVKHRAETIQSKAAGRKSATTRKAMEMITENDKDSDIESGLLGTEAPST